MRKMDNGPDGRLDHGTQSEEPESSEAVQMAQNRQKLEGRVHSEERPITVPWNVWICLLLVTREKLEAGSVRPVPARLPYRRSL